MKTIVRFEVEHPEDVNVFDCVRLFLGKAMIVTEDTDDRQVLRVFHMRNPQVVNADQPATT